MTKLGKFCLYTPLKVLLISGIISFVILLIGISMPRRDYQHYCDMSGVFYGFILFLNVFTSISSYMIVLNFYKSVRDKPFYSFLTFYGSFILLFLVSFGTIASEGIVLALLAYLPFLIPQTYYYTRFRKRLKSGEIIDDFYVESYLHND